MEIFKMLLGSQQDAELASGEHARGIQLLEF